MPFSCFFNVWLTWGANTMWISCPWFVFLDASESNFQAKQRAAHHKGGWVWDHTNLSICLTFEDSHLRTLWLYDIWMSRILAQDIRNDRHWCFSVGRLESNGFLWFPENLSLRPGNVTSQAGGVDEVSCVRLEVVNTKSYIILKQIWHIFFAASSDQCNHDEDSCIEWFQEQCEAVWQSVFRKRFQVKRLFHFEPQTCLAAVPLGMLRILWTVALPYL